MKTRCSFHFLFYTSSQVNCTDLKLLSNLTAFCALSALQGGYVCIINLGYYLLYVNTGNFSCDVKSIEAIYNDLQYSHFNHASVRHEWKAGLPDKNLNKPNTGSKKAKHNRQIALFGSRD